MSRNKSFLVGLLWAAMLPLDAWSQPDTSSQSPFSGALALWHLSDPKDSSGQPLCLDIVCRNDILDAEIGGRRTLVNRYWDPEGDRLYLGAENGKVSFKDIVIRPLEE